MDSNSFMQILLPSKQTDWFEAFLWFVIFLQPIVCSQIVLLCKSDCFFKNYYMYIKKWKLIRQDTNNSTVKSC